MESWATSYGSPSAIEEEETASGEVALVEGEFAAIDGDASVSVRELAFGDPWSRSVIIEGMGHTLPRQAWPEVIDAISANAARLP